MTLSFHFHLLVSLPVPQKLEMPWPRLEGRNEEEVIFPLLAAVGKITISGVEERRGEFLQQDSRVWSLVSGFRGSFRAVTS